MNFVTNEFRHVFNFIHKQNHYEADRICFSLRKGLQAKYTIMRFSGNGQRMRTNIVVIEKRPSFFLTLFDGLGTRLTL